MLKIVKNTFFIGFIVLVFGLSLSYAAGMGYGGGYGRGMGDCPIFEKATPEQKQNFAKLHQELWDLRVSKTGDYNSIGKKRQEIWELRQKMLGENPNVGRNCMRLGNCNRW